MELGYVYLGYAGQWCHQRQRLIGIRLHVLYLGLTALLCNRTQCVKLQFSVIRMYMNAISVIRMYMNAISVIRIYMNAISVIRMYMNAISVIRMYMNAISVILMYYACYICDTYAYRNMAVITAAGSAL